MKNSKWVAVYAAVLVLFTAYISLDTFVIPTRYETSEETEEGLDSLFQSLLEKSGGTGDAAGNGKITVSEDGSASEDGTASDNGSQEADVNTSGRNGKAGEKTAAGGKAERSTAESGKTDSGTAESDKADSNRTESDKADSNTTESSKAESNANVSGQTDSSANEGAVSESAKNSIGAGSSSDRKKTENGKTGSSTRSDRSARSRHEVKSENNTSTDNTAETGTDAALKAQNPVRAATDAGIGEGDVLNEYHDENADITLTKYRYLDTDVYVADVTISSAQYLRTAFAKSTYGKNITEDTSEMAAENGAILAINGDYYGAREKGYVIRNGVIYRDKADTADVLCIYADGKLETVDPGTVTAQELLDRGVWQAFSFGPGLIEAGEISVGVNDEVGRAKASNPRTAIGMIDELHYLFVVSDGRTNASEGLSIYELAGLMKELGTSEAYNLDGGGSSTMVFNGAVINNPTSGGSIKERSVSDIVYISK